MSTIISKLVAQLTLDDSKFNKGLDKSSNNADKFSKNLIKLGGVMSAVFAAKEVVEFAAKMTQLATKSRNVERAFSRLNNVSIASLRKSTGGMISDLDLMQKAVKAVNLGIKQKDLATYFEFATVRAAETGESVDYLVESIVNGIGRKSKLILDNLGISSQQLANEMAKTGDFASAAGNIIREEMAKSTTTVEDVTSGVDKLSASWDNLAVTIAKGGGTESINNLLIAMTGLVEYTNKNWNTISTILEWSIAIGTLGTSKVTTTAFGMLADDLKKVNDEAAKTPQWIISATGQQKKHTFLRVPFQPGAAEQAKVDGPDFSDIDVVADSNELFDGLDEITKKAEEWRVAFGEVFDFADEDFLDDIDIDTAAVVEKLGVGLEETKLDLDLVSGAMYRLTSAAEGMSNALRGMFEGDDVLSSFGDFLVELASLMVQFGVLLTAFGTAQEVFQKGGAYAKIAAGIAMAGLAVKIGASVASIGKTGGGGGASGGGGGVTSTYTPATYDYNREIVLVAKGEDLVGVINKQTYKDGING
ncbi:MAG: hypothetical protein DRN30_02300 [Thermoplasmata archaeon]|nr:MAG: hypothetical protein DRN30_02300 [Thermoplasmata archaeon]